ncbi:MAG: DUF1015 domain-containing protein [Bacteroidia bacterium]|nr:DUF1015 domain-containing protein [Bacteroidia bacterium]
MAHIYPFKAIMPADGLEVLVSANIHIDSPNRLKEIVQGNPLTYLNIVKPHLLSGEAKDPAKHFPMAKKALDNLKSNLSIAQFPDVSFYVYKQTRLSDCTVFLGLVCTVDVEDYFSGHIRIHEKTITEKENQLIQHIEVTGVIGEPVLLTHLSAPSINAMLESHMDIQSQIKDFTDEAGFRHEVFTLMDAENIDVLESLYLKAGDLYIADGHHRSAASAGYYRNNHIAGGKYLAYIVPPEYLKINSFHRAFKSDSNFNDDEFLDALREDFDISAAESAFLPKREHEFGLLLNNQWYILDYKHDCSQLNAVDKLDVALLEEKVFKKILHIHDSKTDNRLEFIKGNVPISLLESKLSEGVFDCIFTVFPCTIQEMFDIADNNMIMPPKSTFIEPKLRTGLFIQSV